MTIKFDMFDGTEKSPAAMDELKLAAFWAKLIMSEDSDADELEEIDTCPMCGAEAFPDASSKSPKVFVFCDNTIECGVIGPVKDTHREAIEAWNRRVE